MLYTFSRILCVCLKRRQRLFHKCYVVPYLSDGTLVRRVLRPRTDYRQTQDLPMILIISLGYHDEDVKDDEIRLQ